MAPSSPGALAQWQEFWRRSDEVKSTNGNCYYGLSVVPTRTRQRNQCSGVFQYLAAQEAADGATAPEGMTRLTIPLRNMPGIRVPARYPDSRLIMNVWTHYLPESGLEVIESPEIEGYDERFSLESHESEMD